MFFFWSPLLLITFLWQRRILFDSAAGIFSTHFPEISLPTSKNALKNNFLQQSVCFSKSCSERVGSWNDNLAKTFFDWNPRIFPGKSEIRQKIRSFWKKFFHWWRSAEHVECSFDNLDEKRRRKSKRYSNCKKKQSYNFFEKLKFTPRKFFLDFQNAVLTTLSQNFSEETENVSPNVENR